MQRIREGKGLQDAGPAGMGLGFGTSSFFCLVLGSYGRRGGCCLECRERLTFFRRPGIRHGKRREQSDRVGSAPGKGVGGKLDSYGSNLLTRPHLKSQGTKLYLPL